MKPKQLTDDERVWRELVDRYHDYFAGGMGAEAVKDLVSRLDLDEVEVELKETIATAKGQRKAKAIKRLKVVSAFNRRDNNGRAINSPLGMILDVVPVIPPDLRPMVQLDGGRFATSDLNDLYRRVINRNNRLSRLLDLEAPEIIIRNEKRMLQEACDALIDNGRRGRAIAGTGNHRLNRAPTLHRLGIQAFMPVLVEGSAIQIHPLVCFAFNADFDGDQMAVHVPLSTAAQKEARELMLSTQNLLSAADGSPVVSPTHDMVLGCYYLTVSLGELIKPGQKALTAEQEKPRKAFVDDAEVIMALQSRSVGIHDPIQVETHGWEGDLESGRSVLGLETTTPGRVVFNTVLPERLRFLNQTMDRKALKALIADCHRRLGPAATTALVDGIKSVGFHYATLAGLTIGIQDVAIPASKRKILEEADTRVAEIDREFRRGFITDDERYEQTVNVWRETTDKVTSDMLDGLDREGAVWMITHSGARGNVTQVHQLAGMRGLMADPSGRIIDLPIKSNLREAMSVLEYFISSHGARKGLADTALRTADSGYLTRRLVDVAQDVITREDDCATDLGTWITREESDQIPEPFVDRLIGRMAALDIVDEKSGETIVARNEEIDERAVDAIQTGSVERVSVRSPLTCQARHGVCRMCYGRDLATGDLVRLGQAVGIIAAQSIGEPGTQLTMRTFHTGGVAGEDITQGLPRVEELFEARIPKGQAIMSEIDGVAEVNRGADESIKVAITHRDAFDTPIKVTAQHEVLIADGDEVTDGQVLAVLEADGERTEIKAPAAGRITKKGRTLTLHSEEVDSREYPVPHFARLRVENGDDVSAGDPLTEGSLNPKDLLAIKGVDTVQRFLVAEVQKVYRSQGVTINDKHVEIIVRQMLRKVTVDSPGDTELLPSELIDRFEFEETNNRILAEGGEPATAQTVLLGVTKASLNTSSFLAAASFQETTRVLTEAAINGAKDHLLGLKENVIIGKLITAGTGAEARALAAVERKRRQALEALAGESLEALADETEFNPFLE